MNSRGKDAEKAALAWLQRQDMQLIATNYTCRLGEIDLIMLEQATLVFIEVRQRKSQQYGGAAASVTLNKQRKIIRCANHYLMCQPQYAQSVCRFDVIAFESNSVMHPPIWYKDAFRL